jgi:phosphoribosylanthranilate isomerase
MSLKTKVLISSVTNLSDARYATGMGVDFVGFSMNETDDDFIGYTNYTAITNWLQDMNFAGEFNTNATLKQIINQAKEFGFTTIISPNNEITTALKEQNFTVILLQTIEDQEDIDALSTLTTSADYVLIESTNHTVLSQEQIAQLSSQLPLLVGTEISANTINDWLDTTDMEGIALKGSEEIRTGFVDLDAMADILEAIEVD